MNHNTRRPPPPAPRPTATSRKSRQQPSLARAVLLATATAIAAIAGFASVMANDDAFRRILSGWLHGQRSVERATLSDEEVATLLTRSTLMALQDANQTGNYGVFRQLAAPAFQQANSAEKLAEVFHALRVGPVDLTFAALERPRWSARPIVGNDSRLRLVGLYPAGANNVRFALAFEAVHGTWRLNEIHVGSEPVAAPAHLAAASR